MTKVNNQTFVEVGSGCQPRDGYIHCDIRPIAGTDYVCNAWAIPFSPESVDEIYARHMLEHLTYRQAKRALKHWLCVLKVSGRIDINVPDLKKHIEQLNKDGPSPYVKDVSNKEHAMAGFYGWQSNDYDIHKWGYTFETLSKLLNEVGFRNIRRIEDTSVAGPMNLRVIAEKDRPFPDLKPDPESLRPRWKYINWNTFIRNVACKLKVKKPISVICRRLRILAGFFKKDYSGKGERQVSYTLDGIRPDHVGRYKFASGFIKKNDVVLDCACGVGYGSFILSRSTDLSVIVAVDIAKRAIEFANKHYHHDKIIYREGNIFSLDIPDNYFDCVVSFETVEHIDGTAFVRLLFKKLKNNGQLIISTPNQDTQPFNSKTDNFHLRHYTPSEFETLLTSNGFEILDRFTQFDRTKEEILKGRNGLFNIAVAKKP